MKGTNFVGLSAMVFSVALALVIGPRLSESAAAMVMGVIIGVTVSLSSIILVLFSAPRPGSRRVPSERPRIESLRPTILLTPDAWQQIRRTHLNPERLWPVIGED